MVQTAIVRCTPDHWNPFCAPRPRDGHSAARIPDMAGKLCRFFLLKLYAKSVAAGCGELGLDTEYGIGTEGARLESPRGMQRRQTGGRDERPGRERAIGTKMCNVCDLRMAGGGGGGRQGRRSPCAGAGLPPPCCTQSSRPGEDAVPRGSRGRS